MKYLWVAVMAFGTPVCAQNADYNTEILPLCLENTEMRSDRASCIGRAADRCLETEAGQSSIGVGYCFTSEWEQWDARLNRAYQDLLVLQVEVAEDNAAYNENIADAVETLRTMQRNWIAYRDAACQWEHVQWGGGTGGGPASAACMMRLTAQQSLFLEEHVY